MSIVVMDLNTKHQTLQHTNEMNACFSERNRKVAINRWKNTIERQRKEIAKNSKKFPILKAKIIAYLMGDGAVMVRRKEARFITR